MSSEENKDTSTFDITVEQRDRLIDVLESLEDLTKRQVSLKFVFVRGAIYGLGTVIGATVLISLLSYIAVHFFGNVISDEETVQTRIETILKQ